MLKWMPAAFAVLMLFALNVRADQTQPPFEIKVEGEKLENVKITIVQNTPSDRTSARATVESYLRVIGFVSGLFFEGQHKDFQEQMEKMTYSAERSLNEKLFSGPCLDEMKTAEDKQNAERKAQEEKEIASGKPPHKRHDPKITGESTDGANTTVETEEITEWSSKTKDGKWETTSNTRKARYVCSAKDGVWQIDRCEKYNIDYSGKADEKGERPMKWEEDKVLAGLLTIFSQAESATVMPEVDSPEKLVRAAMTWLSPARRALTNKLALNFYSQITEKLKPLFTDRSIKQSQEDADKQQKEDTKHREEELKKKQDRKISSKNLEDGSFEVTVAPQSEWSATMVLTVSKTEAGLRITKAVTKRTETDYSTEKPTKTEKLEPMTSPNQMDWN